jgi:hypothetical protein
VRGALIDDDEQDRRQLRLLCIARCQSIAIDATCTSPTALTPWPGCFRGRRQGRAVSYASGDISRHGQSGALRPCSRTGDDPLATKKAPTAEKTCALEKWPSRYVAAFAARPGCFPVLARDAKRSLSYRSAGMAAADGRHRILPGSAQWSASLRRFDAGF